jgi:hypothetical protein
LFQGRIPTCQKILKAGSRCGSEEEWWNINAKNQKNPGSIPSPGE